jgi:teichuronic acid biosynthesis glycosyltransferase TuaG
MLTTSLPIVSIIMPSFNSSIFIEASIDSVLNQEYRGWELLVVDGGSSDNTPEIVTRYSLSDRRVRLVPNPDDKGPAHARSTGVRHARGEYIAFLDADDIWLSKKLTIQMEFMIRTNAEFSYTKYMIMNSKGTEASCPLAVNRQYSYPYYLFLRGIGCSTVIIKRILFSEEILEAYGPWLGEDTLWWLMILRGGAQANGILEPLVLYRDAEGSLSKHRLRNQISIWEIYRKRLNLSPLVAILSYVSYLFDVVLRRIRYRTCTKIFGKKKVGDILR